MGAQFLPYSGPSLVNWSWPDPLDMVGFPVTISKVWVPEFGSWPVIPNSRTSCTARARRTQARQDVHQDHPRDRPSRPRSGLPDPAANPRLRAAIIAARGTQHAQGHASTARSSAAAGGGDDANYEEVRYEGYGPGGVALIVEALTDNRNRTAGEVRTAFTKHGGTLGETGSVAFMFEPHRRDRLSGQGRRARTPCSRRRWKPAPRTSRATDGVHEITTAMEDFVHRARRAGSEVRPGARAPGCNGGRSTRCRWKRKRRTSLLKLIDVLEDSDDVQTVVSANFEIADDTAGAADRLMTRIEIVRLVGLDPGLRHTGWGIIEVAGNRLSYRRRRRRQFRRRPCRWPSGWCRLHDGLRAVIDALAAGGGRGRGDLRQQEPGFDPEAGHGARRGAAGAGHGRAAGGGVPANLVKKSVVGAGHAEKEQVQMMVRRAAAGLGRREVGGCRRRAGRGDLPRASSAPRSRSGAPRISARCCGDRQADRHARQRSRATLRSSTCNGVGYLVLPPAARSSQLGAAGAPVSLLIETQVREDAINLYGFCRADRARLVPPADDRSGRGSRKWRWRSCRVLAPDELSLAIAAQDKAIVHARAGVGPKLAQRIVTELKDKAGNIALGAGAVAPAVAVNGSGKASGGAGGGRGLRPGQSRLPPRRGLRRGRQGGARPGRRGEPRALIRAGLKELSQ